ncbi:MAG TPA: PstS family phosphate ABC transporter substrate-binding protein [Propionicimonas sp.]|nr:PstS family phosphate ABC transporter substrate-binding protein [Propionicimonas sp.]
MNSRSIPLVGIATLAAALTLSACGGQPATPDPAASGASSSAAGGTVNSDGSSTVAPLAEAAASAFAAVEPGIRVTVATSGTGGGFKKFCAGETDISNASRPIKDEEKAACAAAGISFTEVVIANDGLTVVINPENTWAKCMTVAQLQKMWAPDSEGKVMNWNQVDPSFPDEKLTLFGAGTDSGTFDYFTLAINGEEGASRTDYSPSEDDNITVQGVAGEKGAVGYFGLSYAEENADKLVAAQIDGGKGCVTASVETVQSGEYTPLSRPLFIYVANESYKKPAVKSFVDYFVENSDAVSKAAGFVPLTAEQQKTAADELASIK